MLKRSAQAWRLEQFKAIQRFKEFVQKLLPLKFQGKDKELFKLMLVINSGVLFFLKDKPMEVRRHVVTKSGQFTLRTKHYHLIFKEILSVKSAIKKSEFHLLGHHFLI